MIMYLGYHLLTLKECCEGQTDLYALKSG
jgi:hypothetical protein